MEKVITLPKWEDVARDIDNGRAEADLSPLEKFVYDNEPADDDGAWRDSLSNAILNAMGAL